MAIEDLVWWCLWRLRRIAVLLAVCLGMLQLNVHLAKASLGSAGALEGLKLAKAALSEVAETMASNARLVQAAAESTRLSEPSLFPSLGGFSHVTIDVLSLISSFWPLARPSLQQMLL